jgi:hypothetical protein
MGVSIYRGAVLAAILVIAGILALFSAPAQAAGGNCFFRTDGTMLLAFGTVDPSSAGPIVRSVTPGAVAEIGDCKNFTMKVTADMGSNSGGSGVRRMRNAAGTSFIPYALALPADQPMPGNGTYVPVGITGTITAPDYENAAAGDHSDTVVVYVDL